MDQIFYVHDCTCNLIFLDQEVLDYNKNLTKLSNEQYMRSAKAISESALIFEMNNSFTRYYYYSFALLNSLLIGATFYNGIWKVKYYFENPSGPFLLTLFKKYLLKDRITMYYQNEIAEDFFGSINVLRFGSPKDLYI